RSTPPCNLTYCLDARSNHRPGSLSPDRGPSIMKNTSARRLGALVAAGVIAALVPLSTPANAATGAITYTSTIQGNNAPLTINADTNAPANVASGATITPKLSSTVTFNAAFVQGLRDNGFTAIQGTGGKSNVTTNGAATPVDHTFAKKTLPTSGGLT